MEYLDLIKNTDAKIKTRFEELHATWKREQVFKGCTNYFSTSSLINEYQLLDSILSYYPVLSFSDDEGIDICISFVQSIANKNTWREFSSLIRFTENGDLDLGKSLYITSDICLSSGPILFENETYEIMVKDVYQLDSDISGFLDKIFFTFKNNKELIISALQKIKQPLK